MKYIWTILLIISAIVLYFYHGVVFDKKEFTKRYSVDLNLKNDYMHYYYLVDENPIYVLKKDMLDKYVVWAFDNKKTGLIYSNQQTIADFNYISDIQYAAAFKDIFNAKFLENELNYVTNLSPFWVDIYNFAQLILPVSKKSKIYTEGKIENWYKVILLGEKGVYFNCDKRKIKNILKLSDDKFFQVAYSKKGKIFEKNKNPCKDYKLPENLAFNYMYYIKDYKDAKKYYKIASFHKNVPYGIVGMVSVLNSLAGEHEKAIYMFVQRLQGIEDTLNDDTISDKEYNKMKKYYDSTLKKLQEEFNLYIISQADKNGSECKRDYNCLLEKGYILDEIKKIDNSCRKLDLKNIKTISDLKGGDTSEIIEKTKCILLGLGYQQGYITNNKLVSPLLNTSLYKYDTERGWKSYRLR